MENKRPTQHRHSQNNLRMHLLVCHLCGERNKTVDGAWQKAFDAGIIMHTKNACGHPCGRVIPLLVWLSWATFLPTGNTGRLCGSDLHCVQCDGSRRVGLLAARLLLPPAMEP